MNGVCERWTPYPLLPLGVAMQGSELKERLRRHEGVGAALAHDRGQTGRFVSAIMDEAASEIERLEAANAALMAERSNLIATKRQQIERLEVGVKEMTEAANDYAHQAARSELRARAAEAQRDKLKEALRWFVDREAPIKSKFSLLGPKDMFDAMVEAFRRAREALASIEGEKADV